MGNEQRIDKIKIREDEKKNFKQHLLWIVLKMTGQKSEKFYFYDFEAESPEKRLKFDMAQFTTEGDESESKIIKSKSFKDSKKKIFFESGLLNNQANLNDWLFDVNGLQSKSKATMKRRTSSSSMNY